MKQQVNRSFAIQSLSRPGIIMAILISSVLLAIIIGKYGLFVATGLIAIPLAIVFIFIVVERPFYGFLFSIGLSFVLLGFSRYIELPFPIGTIMDGVIGLIIVALFIQSFPKTPDFSPLKNDVVYLSAIWLFYCMAQLGNPEARSFSAWMSSIRPMALYTFIFPVFGLLFLNSPKNIKRFLYVWAIFSLLGTIKGFLQIYIGLDYAERAWLEAGAWDTHLLFGKLRVFSFFTDAGQFGANQAYAGVVFLTIAIAVKNKFEKFFFFIVSLAGFYGMFLSGTRGAIAVPFAGLALYVFHRKNILIMVLGAIMGLSAFVFFKYTTIGQGNYQIARMRSAFNPDDPSLQIRLANQRILKVYMASRPIGGGLGHGGIKAQKFTPNSYLSSIATDSWYVLIWVELGVVGLILHLFILFYIVGKSSYLIMFKVRDKELEGISSGLCAGIMGIMLASYGNAVIWQMPTNQVFYSSFGLIMNCNVVDNKIRIGKRKKQFKEKYGNRMRNKKSFTRHFILSY